MEVHERKKSKRLGHGTHRVFGQDRGQADRVSTQLPPDCMVGVRREVTFVEQEVEHVVNRRQARPKRLHRRRLDIDWHLA
jgi:hypothetical protein